MAAVWYRFRAELRARWRAWLGLALVIGIAGGAVIAMVAGARRTDTAYERFLRDQRAFDAIAACPTGAGRATCDLDEFRTLPQIEGAAAGITFGGGSSVVRTERGLLAQPDSTDPNYTGPGEVEVVVPADRRLGTDVGRLKILDGRRPDPRRPDEAAVNFALANRLGLEVGDRLRVRFPEHAPERGPMMVEIVGIEVGPFEVPPASGQWEAGVHLTAAFHRQATEEGWLPPDQVFVRLRPGATVAEVRAELERRHLAIRVLGLGSVFGNRDGVRRSIRPQAVALWIVAGLTLLAALAVFGQALARLTFLESGDLPTLRALGFGRVRLWGLALVRAGAIGGAAAAAAVATAIAASPLTPIGLARTIESKPGVAVNAGVLLVGALLTVVLVVLLAAVPAWRLTRVAGTRLDVGASRRRRSTVGTVMTRWSVPAPVVVGARMALEPGRGRTAVPVRSSIAGIGVGLLALMAALTFSTSLGHLVSTPALSGWNWDVAALVPYDDGDADEPVPRYSRAALRSAFRAEPAVQALTFGTYFRPFPVPDYALALGSHGVKVDILTFEPGAVGPTVLEGRAPAGADEILLGPETLDALGLEVGDRIRAVARVGDREDARLRKVTASLRIVGTGVVPLSGGESRLGRGATLTLAGVRAMNPLARPDVIWLRLTPGTDPVQVIRDVAHNLGTSVTRRQAAQSLIGFQFSDEVLNVKSVDRLPLVLAGLMALMAVGVLAHVLTTGVRSRRRDLAILAALGFRRRQVRASVAWQATTTAGVAVLVGLPVGIVLGRVIWRRYAEGIGVVPAPVVSWAEFALVIVATLLVANLVATLPAGVAARTRPAVVLRSE